MLDNPFFTLLINCNVITCTLNPCSNSILYNFFGLFGNAHARVFRRTSECGVSLTANLLATLCGTDISLCDPCGIYICDIIYVCELKQWNTPKVVYYYINYIWRICNCVLIFNFKDKVFYIVPSNKEL